MSRSKTETAPAPEAATIYTTDRLLRSKALAAFQPDVVRVALTKEAYTIDEAVAAIRAALSQKRG